MKGRALLLLTGAAVVCAAGQGGAAEAAGRGPLVFACVSDEPAPLTVTFLGAQANRARLAYKGRTIVAHHAVSADGALYTAKDVEFWSKGEDGVLEWRGEKAKCARDN